MDIDDVNFETLEITREGHVLEVVLDRPGSDVNAINGTVHRAVPSGDIAGAARDMGLKLAAIAPLAVRYTRRSMNKLIKDAVNLAFDNSTALEIVTFLTEDHQEALSALASKRAPKYHGR